MGKIGTGELLLIFALALIVFGPSKLPELGKLAGRTIGSFRRYVNSFENEWQEEEAKKSPAEKTKKEEKKTEINLAAKDSTLHPPENNAKTLEETAAEAAVAATQDGIAEETITIETQAV